MLFKGRLFNGLSLQEGKSYKLGNYDNGDSNYAVYETIYNSRPTDGYQASYNLEGSIQINKLDKLNHIASGTFYFDANNNKGGGVHITDGRLI